LNFTVNKKLFDAFCAAGKANGVAGLPGPDADGTFRHNSEGICGIDDFGCGTAGNAAAGGGGFRGNNFQQVVIPADGNSTGKTATGGGIVREHQLVQQMNMLSFRFFDSAFLQKAFQGPGADSLRHCP
jgi:hypothetical protein